MLSAAVDVYNFIDEKILKINEKEVEECQCSILIGCSKNYERCE